MNWRRFFGRARADAEQQQELESYLEITTEEYIAQGMQTEAARQAARRKLGNLTRIREEIYKMNTATLIDGTLQELRQSVRMLRLNPAFSITAILTLALGIGATTAIFSVVNGVLIRPLPYPQPEKLVSVWHSAVLQGRRANGLNVAPAMYFTYLDQNQAFDAIGAWNSATPDVTGLGDPEQVRAVVITAGVLPALGVQPFLGRWFSSADDTPGTPETVILSYGYWQRKFGGDRGVIGRSLNIGARLRNVIGVMPASFRFLDLQPDMLLPQRFQRAPGPNFSFQGIARMKPGVTLPQASADIARMLPEALKAVGMPPQAIATFQMRPDLRSLKQDVVGDVGQVLWVLMGSIGLVLLIACANVANLLLVRAETRRRELAVRAALGAGWGRIARELLVESVVLASLGGALGIALAHAGLRLLVSRGPANLPRLAEISIDSVVLAFAAGISLVCGLAFGLIPVFKHVFKHAGPSVATALRGSGRTASLSRERHRARNTLVAGQVALALVLLVSSGLMIRSFQAMHNVQPGFTRPEQVQTVRIAIAPGQVAEPERVTGMQTGILDKIAAIPGVTSVAFSTGLPMEVEYIANQPVGVEDKALADGDLPPIRRLKYISPGLFQTLGTRLVAGRDFTWADIQQKREVAVVSENFAREIWGEPAAALGRRIIEWNIPHPREIVGVVGDINDEGVNRKAPATVYWPARPSGVPESVPRAVTIAIRSNRAGTESFIREIREAIWSVNPNLALTQVRTLGEVYDASMARTSFTLVMLAIAGAMALALGVIGIYGVISYAVSQQQREIGIRLALGAQLSQMTRMFVRHALLVTGAGVLIGLAASVGLMRLMGSLLFGVSPLDPLTYAAVPAVLTAAAAIASYLPARRAASVDPIETLRGE